MQNLHNKKIAIVADWLIDFGGAELVIEELLKIFPNAEVFTSVCFLDHPMLKNRKIHTSFIQKIPFINKRHKIAGILRPLAFRKFDFSNFDIIISSSSAESKNAGFKKRGKNTMHFCYCHTPIRYYWSHFEEYKNMLEFGKLNFLAKWFFPKIVNFMRKLDYEASQKVDVFWANSKTTANRIKKFYNRDSKIIYPGINTKDFYSSEKKDFYFAIGRCIPYKKFDLLVESFNKNGKKLKIATNTDNILYHELKNKSKKNIEWIFKPTKQQRNKLYSEAKAFLFPPEEDFGLVPVESMASGTPVIAYGVGGATESIIENKTGIFFAQQTPKSLNTAIEKFEKMKFEKTKIIERAQDFSMEKFDKKIIESINKNFCKK